MGLTEQEAKYLEQQENQMAALQAQHQQGQVSQAQTAMAVQEQENNMIKDQLDLGGELEMIENLLRGRVLKKDTHGILQWTDPEDNEMVILSEHGIHLIMNTISFYINKNTLLSNYDEDTINKKMEDFACDLADTIFMEYEKVFQYPSFEDCKKVLEARIKRKTELKKFALEMVGKKADTKVIEKNLISELEGHIDKEIQKIKEQIIKNKLKRFMLLIREVQDAIHSTYLRAWKGQERTTLRQHIHISESRGMNNRMPQQPSKINPLNWLRSN